MRLQLISPRKKDGLDYTIIDLNDAWQIFRLNEYLDISLKDNARYSAALLPEQKPERTNAVTKYIKTQFSHPSTTDTNVKEITSYDKSNKLIVIAISFMLFFV